MHDIKFIRENPAAFDEGLKRRGLNAMSKEILGLDLEWRTATQRLQEMQSLRNDASKKIGQAKAAKNEAEAQRLMAEVAALKEGVPATELRVRESEEALNELLSTIPNLPAADVPDGPDETANVEVRRWGTPRSFAFTPRDHVELGERLARGMDFEAGARIATADPADRRSDLAPGL